MTLVSKKEIETNKYELEISVGGEEFEKACASAYRKNVKKINVPGFRPGKAPRAFIEKMYGKEIFYEDAVNELYPSAYSDAVEEAGIEPHIYTKTSYVKIEGRATVGALSDLASHMTFNFRHEESYLLEALGPSEPSAEGASDEAYAPGSESSMSDAHEGIAQAEEEARAAEEQAEAEEAAVADTSLFTPALRLSTAYTLLQTNYADEIAVIDPYEIVSEQTVLTTLYVAKCIATGATESSLRETGIEQLRIEALAWAESAGLDDLYESGVDTYAETIGVIRTYLGMF